MVNGWLTFGVPRRDPVAMPSVTIRELIDRYGEFYEEDGHRLMTHRGVIRVARQVRRARRDGTLVLPENPEPQSA